MTSIVWNTGERAFVDGMLGGQSNYGSPPIVPSAGGNWGIGLGTQSGGVNLKADVMAQILEVGTVTASGYARATITRDQTGTGWPASSLVGGHYSSTAPQVSFSFTAAPSPNGATLWFMAGSTVLNADNCIFGSDLAATRTFGNGDVERVTPTFSQT